MIKPDYPSVLLIYTGGTIGMIENPETGALEAFNFDQLQENVPELKRFNYRISSYQFTPPIDSSDMEPKLWAKLVKIIQYNYENFDGFVILHGTDTMAYTASALSFMLENLSKPVILTGSQLPIGVLRTDGKENLITSSEIAAAKHPDGRAVVPEVCIFFENLLLRGNRTTKINAENFNAFRSFNYPPLATAGIHIKYEYDRIRQARPDIPMHAHFAFDTNVVILTIFPGIQESIVSGVLNAGAESRGAEDLRLRKRAPEALVHPPAEGSHGAGHRHREHLAMPDGHGRNGALRDGAAPAGRGCHQRVRLDRRERADQADVPVRARADPATSAERDEPADSRRVHKG